MLDVMRLQTYTNHTGMSQLVPVLEVMIGVTRYSLAFDIWGQAQLYKKKKKWYLKKHFHSAHHRFTIWCQSYPAVCCSEPLCQQDSAIRPLQDARRCHDQSCLEEDSTASQSPPAGMVPAAGCCWSVRAITDSVTTGNNVWKVMVLLLTGAVTTSIHSSWPSAEQEAGLCHDRP